MARIQEFFCESINLGWSNRSVNAAAIELTKKCVSLTCEDRREYFLKCMQHLTPLNLKTALNNLWQHFGDDSPDTHIVREYMTNIVMPHVYLIERDRTRLSRGHDAFRQVELIGAIACTAFWLARAESWIASAQAERAA